MYLERATKNLLNYIFFITQLLIVIALISTKKLDYIRDVIFINALAAVYMFIEIIYNIFVSNYIRICMMIVVFIHNFAGKYLEFYLKSTIFDKALHVFGIYSFVLFFYSIMNQATEISFKSKLNKFIFLVILGISLGAIFEIMEFAVDTIINPKIHNQPDLTDTDLDMIADVVGALTAAFHICFFSVQLRLTNSK